MILRYVMTLVALALWPMCATAQELAPPQGRILLTVTGTIGTTNHEDAAAFDLDMLRDLGAETFETTTIWTDGPQTFEGVTAGAAANPRRKRRRIAHQRGERL